MHDPNPAPAPPKVDWKNPISVLASLHRVLPLAVRVAIYTLGLGSLASLGAVYAWQDASAQEVVSDSRRELEMVAGMLATTISGDQHHLARQGDPTASTRIRDLLRTQMAAASLSEADKVAPTRAYTVAGQGKDLEPVVVAGPPIAKLPSTVEAARTLEDGDLRSEGPFPFEGGTWVVAAAPIRSGEAITGVLIVDRRVDALLTSAKERAIEVSSRVAFGAALVISLAITVLIALLAQDLKRLHRAVRRTNTADASPLEIPIRWGPELRQLAEAVGEFQRGVSMLAAEMMDTVELLDGSVKTLQDSTSAQNATISQQAATLHQTQVTAQEIKQTSALAAQRADAVLKVAERADQLSRSGELALEQSLETLTTLRTQVEEISRTVQSVGERSRQIGGITQSVKSLADQSNMLALNAAIEAARSGEQGRGFSVLAHQIRNLANQSIEATNQVRAILEDMSNAVTLAVSITETGTDKMERGLAEIRSFGENYRELAAIVKEDANAGRQIAAAVSQQNLGINQIFTALTDQMRMMEETVSRVSSTDVAAAALKEISQGVLAMARRYRLKESTGNTSA